MRQRSLAEGYQKMDKNGYPRCYFRIFDTENKNRKDIQKHLARLITEVLNNDSDGLSFEEYMEGVKKNHG